MNNAFTVNLRAGDGTMVEVPEELLDLLEFSAEACRLSEGRVNIAMGAVLSLWHEARTLSVDDPGKAYVPSEEDLEAAAQHCSIDGIIIDRNTSSVRLSDPLMSIDLGAVAKGWTVEKIAKSLIEDGTISDLRGMAISAGGNVRVLGPKDGNGTWTIAVQDPREGASASDYMDTLQLEDLSLVTSGVNQRYFEAGGKRWHHIIDPDTLYPREGFLSVTVLTEDSGLADALSTALFNMSMEDGKALLEALKAGTKSISGISVKTAEAVWILPDGSMQYTSGYASYRKK
jgi:thiamine biosynthesis lipoprotein